MQIKLEEINQSGGKGLHFSNVLWKIKHVQTSISNLLACFFLDFTQDVEKGGLHAVAVQSVLPTNKM